MRFHGMQSQWWGFPGKFLPNLYHRAITSAVLSVEQNIPREGDGPDSDFGCKVQFHEYNCQAVTYLTCIKLPRFWQKPPDVGMDEVTGWTGQTFSWFCVIRTASFLCGLLVVYFQWMAYQAVESWGCGVMYKPDLASMFQQDISELDQLEISVIIRVFNSRIQMCIYHSCCGGSQSQVLKRATIRNPCFISSKTIWSELVT